MRKHHLFKQADCSLTTGSLARKILEEQAPGSVSWRGTDQFSLLSVQGQFGQQVVLSSAEPTYSIGGLTDTPDKYS